MCVNLKFLSLSSVVDTRTLGLSSRDVTTGSVYGYLIDGQSKVYNLIEKHYRRVTTPFLMGYTSIDALKVCSPTSSTPGPSRLLLSERTVCPNRGIMIVIKSPNSSL